MSLESERRRRRPAELAREQERQARVRREEAGRRLEHLEAMDPEDRADLERNAGHLGLTVDQALALDGATFR